jgi:methionyl-tRNA formyltransferase
VSAGAGRSPRVVVFGYHDIGAACLEILLERGADVVAVVTHQDDPAETIWFASVAALAISRGIPVFTPENPAEPRFVEEMGRLRPELLFSFYYRHLLPQALLELPSRGAINLHGSLLPKYRGRAPINWVLVNGETITGVTLHYMDARADHGDIIAQRSVLIVIEDTALTLLRKLTAAARQLLADTFPLLLSGRAPRIRQDDTAATRVGRRRPGDGLIDWSASAWRVYNLIRAVTHPFPGAFTYLESRQVYLWAARPPSKRWVPGPPGRVLGVGEGRALEVATGDGVLEVLRLQLEGSDEIDGADFATAVLAEDARCGLLPILGGDAGRLA